MKSLLIGQVARQAGVGIGAIRLYERMGLIPAPMRSRSGYRQFPEDTVLRVRVICSGKQLGFTLRQMARFFAELRPNGMSGAEKDAIIADKLREIDAKVRSLHHARKLLLHLKDASGRPTSRAECALAEAARGMARSLERSRARSRRVEPRRGSP